MMRRLGTTQRGRFWKKKKTFLDTILGKSVRSCKNYVIKNHKFYFDIPQILIVDLIFFQQNMGFCYNFDSCFQ
jgi:hypothetical protein